MTIPIPDGIRRIIGETFQEDQDRRDREEADAWLQRLKDTPMAKLGPDEPLNISTERPKWMRKGGYDTTDFTSTAQPALVPEEGDALFGQFDEDREYSSLGPSPELSPVDIAGDPLPAGAMQDGRGGPENGPLSEATITDIRKAREARQSGALRQALAQQPGTPDDAAKDFDLAEQMGVNRGEVASNRKSYEFAKTARDIDALKVTAPRLRTWLDDARENLEFAHDDIDNLSWWETAGRMVWNTPGALYSGLVGLGESALGLGQAGVDVADEMARAPSPALAAILGNAEEANRLARQGNLPRDPTKGLGAVSEGISGVRKSVRDYKLSVTPQGSNDIESGYYSGLSSLATQAPLIAASVITMNPGIATVGMSMTTAGEAYSRTTDENPEMSFADRAGYALRQAGIEFATELVPNAFIVDALTKGTVKDVVTGAVKSRLAEHLGEQAATTLQDLDDWLTLNPNGTWQEYIEARPSAAMQTFVATLVGVEGQMLAGKAAEAGARKLDEKAQDRRTEELSKTFDAMAQGAKDSKLLKRLPEKFRQVVAQVTKDGPLESVRVQPEAFEELAQSAGVSTEALAQAFRIDPADINSALKTGEDVVIPSGNYAAALQTAKKEIGVSGEAIHAAFAPNMRLRAEDFTAKEQAAMKAVYEEERQAAEEASADTTFSDAADRVREAVRTQLADAKVFNNEAASTQAQIASEMIITLAERTGQDPEKLWNEVGFKVQTEVGEDGELAQSVARSPVETNEIELSWASQDLTPRQFEAWKGARDGLSNEQIAERINESEPDAVVSPEAVKVALSQARAMGYDAQTTHWNDRGLAAETQRVINLKARGAANKDIADAVFPDRDSAKARNQVGVLVNRHKALIEARRRELTGKPAAEQVTELAQEKRGGFTGINLSQDPVIRLYASANLSTFSHEAAHWYLTTLEKLAQTENPHPFVISQFAAVREWAGKSAEFQIYDETGQITPEGVEVHEAFSETFEAYLREGKAPSTALRQVFATMKAWLLRVYKSIRNIGSRVNLNEVIKDVFDRMLATDEAIAAVRNRLDQDADRMAKALLDKGIITEKAYERTRERLQAAREKATADLQARLMEEYERSQKAWWKDQERQTRRDVASEIDERPEQRAYAWLTGRGWRDTQADHVERAAEEEFQQAVDEGLFETDATDDTLKLLQQRAVERGLGPLILLFRTTSGRVIAFPGENGSVYHDVARIMFGLGDLKLDHGIYNPRKWPTLEAMNVDPEAWYATSGEQADAQQRELAQRTYSHDKHREQVKAAYDFLRDNPEYTSGPLSKIMEAVEVSAYAADRARRLIRRGELAQLDGPVVVYRGGIDESAGVGRLGTGVYSAEDPEIGAEWGGEQGSVKAFRISGRLFDLDETTAEGLENYGRQEDSEAAKKLFARLKSEGYVGVRDPWSGHINVFVDGAMERYPQADMELGATWTNELELGQSKSSLDMSEPARMQRAREQGFDVDTPLYHGTTEAFEEFDPAKTGSKFGYDKKGFFFSDDPRTARSYSYTPDEKRDSWARFSADGKAMADARTVKAYVRLKNPITLEELAAHPEYKRAPYEDPTDIYDNNRALIEKISEGRDGVDLRFRGQRLVNVFDPANIRRTDAAFDPSQSGSSKLLAQTGGNARTTPPLALPPMRLDLAAVKEQYGDEALAAIPPEVRAYSAQATDADQFAEVARDVRKTLAKKRPKSLWKFLSTSRTIGGGNDKISYRGIRDDGGELIKIIGEKKAAPGLIADGEDAKKVRSYTIEHAAEAAWSEGYFNGPNPPTPAEFLDALRADIDGQAKLYARADMADIQEIADAEAWSAWFDQNGIDINEKDPAVLKANLEEALSSGAENAIGPDEAAAMLGGVLKTKALPDGNALLQALKAGTQRDKLIREETKRRMIEKHGDIFRNGTIAEEAKTYARNEIQLRQTEIELEALAKAAGQFAANNLAKQQAIENLRTKQVREVLNYNQWLVLEQRWGKKALEAAEKGKFDEAARYKKFQLINLQMFREGRKLAEDIEKTRKTLIAYGTKPRQQRLYAAGKAYADNMNSLLDDYQLRNETKSGENKRLERAAWIKAQMASIDPYAAYQDTTKTPDEQRVAAAEEIEKSRALASLGSPSEAQSYKSLTVDQFSALNDEASMIWRMATLADQFLKAGERRRLSLAGEDIVAEVEANQPKERAPEPIETDTAGEVVKSSLEQYFARHRSLHSLAHQFAGGKDGGMFWRYVVRPLNEAFAHLSTLRKTMGEDVAKLYGAFSKAEQERMYRDRQTFSGIGRSLTTQGRLAIALNWGNEKNRQRIMDAYGWTGAQVQEVLDSLSKRDWDWVQSVWDYLDTWFPEANKVHERIHGVSMDKVAPLPIATRFGVYRGGYYPIKFDPKASSKSAQRQMDADGKMQGGRIGTRTQVGYGNKRVEGKVTLPLRLSALDVIMQHLDEVARSIATEEALLDVGRVVKRKDVEDAIVGRHGRQVYNTIVAQLVTAKFGMEGTSGLLAHLRNGATVIGLSWKVATAALQILGASNSIVRVGAPWVALGYARMGKGPIPLKNAMDETMAKSEFMRHRRGSQSPEVSSLLDAVKNKWTPSFVARVVPRELRSLHSWMVKNGFALMANVQFLTVDTPTWWGAYYKATSAGAMEADAIAMADQAVVDAQGGGEIHQLAAMQSGAGTKYASLLRVLNNYMSYMFSTYNLATQKVRNANTFGKVAALALDMTLLAVVPVAGKMLLDLMTRGIGADDEPEDWLEKYLREQVAFLFGPFVGISQFAGSARGDDAYGYKGPAGLGIFAEASRMGAAAAEGDFDESFWRPANRVGGMIAHYPASQLDATVRGAQRLWDGETTDMRELFFGPPPN